MSLPPHTEDLLTLRPRPDAARALRSRAERIVRLWTEAVERHLPHADPLTVKQVRDSIPTVLEKIALALETAAAQAVQVLQEVGIAHGVARFQQQYDIEEVIIEYRLLRRIIFDELYRAAGFKLSFADAVPVDAGLDTALHQGVVHYVRNLTTELKSVTEAESKFLAFLAHDLRNNLHSVMLMLELVQLQLAGSAELAQAAADVHSLQTTVQRTVQGMNRLLEAERLRRHEVELQLGPVDLHVLADELITQAALDTQGKDLRFDNAVPQGAAAQSDRSLLTLVIQNLLGNAVKYSTHGVIRIEAREDPLGWRVLISDEGPGIAPERVSALFEAFTRGETHGQAGIGLGLSIASHAARRLGTELNVESTLGKGTRFSFKLSPAVHRDAD